MTYALRFEFKDVSDIQCGRWFDLNNNSGQFVDN